VGAGIARELVAEIARFISAEPVDHVEFLDRVFFIRSVGDEVELRRTAADVTAFNGTLWTRHGT
jgi:hypothetical protein